MLFNTVEFLIFFIIVLAVYWLLPGKVRYLWLLAGSYYFYMQWNPYYILLLFSVTLITYAGGLIIDRLDKKDLDKTDKNHRQKVLVLTSALVICLSVLGIFKYADFFVSICNSSLHIIGKPPILWTSKLILPVGISFYTLQSLGYLIDVYRGETYVEKNFLKFALFVSFFPQLVAGPIERSKNLLKQLATVKKFDYENIRKGFLLILYGMFLKVMVADRAATFVDMVYGDCITYGGLYVFIATLLFAIQIYCDFHGYSTIARGVALTMGFELVENFNAPYFSKSVREFWQRWHISLSSWFKDYLYIPLGGNRKGKLRKNINLMLVFSISGLWHGADFSFVLWGFLNGIYQIIGENVKKVLKICKKDKEMQYDVKINNKTSIADKNTVCDSDRGNAVSGVAGVVTRVMSTIVTFLLVSLTWLFFRAKNIAEAKILLKSMLTTRNFHILTDGSIFTLGIDRTYFIILLLSILIIAIIDYLKYKNVDVASKFLSSNYILRCGTCMLLIFAILLFGCYGEMYDAATFIYFQF